MEFKLRRFVNDYVAPPKTAAKLRIALETFERMKGEIAAMGARTPHELMRCAEVTFIRDCAELAARASLVRTESRWGLYHDRADLPERDDDEWFWHLNVRRGPDGTPEFVKRAVTPYRVPVPEFTVPVREHSSVTIGDPIGAAGPSLTARGDAAARMSSSGGPDRVNGTSSRSDRVVEVLRLTETETEVEAAVFEPYLNDPDARVRRAAVASLAEAAPAGTGGLLVRACGDEHGTVRHPAAAALRELTEILPFENAGFRGSLAEAARGTDPVVRSALLDVIRQGRAGDAALYAAALADPDRRVRVSAVRGLVSVGADTPEAVTATLVGAAADPSRDVRIAVAEGISALAGTGSLTGTESLAGTTSLTGIAAADVLAGLAADGDPLVRAAALKAVGALGCPPPLDALAIAALADTAWQVRAGAAEGLGGAATAEAIAALASAATDPHADVRKAAVIALANRSATPEAASALAAAADDTDADVRAYARHAAAASS